MGKELITSHDQLEVYQIAFQAAMEIFEMTKEFPKEEMYSLTNQIRRSSRSVCANLTEAWRKRRYKAAFLSKLCDAETEAAETQTWLEFAFSCRYMNEEDRRTQRAKYDRILGKIVMMIVRPEPWLLLRGDR